MYRCIFALFLLLTACTPSGASAESIYLPSETAIYTATTVLIPLPSTTPSPMILVPTRTKTAPTVTKTPIPTLLPTPYGNGRINCPGSIALMYHRILSEPGAFYGGIGIDSDLVSFKKVITYLVDEGYYFPTPDEFADDIEDLVCEQRYAIITIDDSWNDPETMGVTRVLAAIRDGKDSAGAPKVWFGIITRARVPFMRNGVQIDQWEHLKELQKSDLTYAVSHSQTHSAELVDIANFNSPLNDSVFAGIAGEVGPSRKDFLDNLGSEPRFFIYPGGNVTPVVSSRLSRNGYSGGFTVTPGGLDKAYPGYLPRINGGYGCDRSSTNNAECVIEKIKQYSGD